jgi:putative ABC transport system substrate-binding protein
VRRREFMTLLGGTAVTWPLAARAQQPERMRRIGVLMNRVADDPEAQARIKALVQGLQQLGWVEGRNVRMDVRWTAGIADRVHRYAAELVALMPDVILADGAVSVSALQGATRSVPIIFVAGRRRLRQELGATGRQYHWVYGVRIRYRSEVARTA